MIEMMLAVAITVAVVGGVGSAFVGIVKMSKTSMAEAELSVAMRTARNRLLFHIELPESGLPGAGALSGEEPVLPEGAELDESAKDKYGLYTVTLVRQYPAGTDSPFVRLRERIVVPVFGKEQMKEAGNVFHD